MVANLIADLRKAAGKGVCNVKMAVDMQVCNNEITCTLSKVLRGMTEEEVQKAVHNQVMVTFGEQRVRNAWIINQKSIAIFIRNLRGRKEDNKEELTERRKGNNDVVKWRKQAAVVASITLFV